MAESSELREWGGGGEFGLPALPSNTRTRLRHHSPAPGPHRWRYRYVGQGAVNATNPHPNDPGPHPHQTLCPTQEHEKYVSKSNGFDVVAIRDNWNLWVDKFSQCPVTGGPAAVSY